MKKIRLSDEKQEGKESFRTVDMVVYLKKRFGMFGGEETEAEPLCDNDMVVVIIDRVGKILHL